MLLWWRLVRRAQKAIPPSSGAAARVLLLGTCLLQASPSANAQEAIHSPPAQQLPHRPQATRLAELVREDFFQGLAGDRQAFQRAMKVCEETLAREPQHAEAMVWHGSGLLGLAGEAFQKNDVPKGLALWKQGLAAMNRAATLQPDNVAVLIPRGATLLEASRYTPDSREANTLLKTAVADYEKVLQLQAPYFESLSTHARGELLFALAEGFHRLAESAKAQAYFQRIVADLKGSPYASRAENWLKTGDVKILQGERGAACIGCHEK